MQMHLCVLYQLRIVQLQCTRSCSFLSVCLNSPLAQMQYGFIFLTNQHTFCVVFTKRILFVEKSFFENTPVPPNGRTVHRLGTTKKEEKCFTKTIKNKRNFKEKTEEHIKREGERERESCSFSVMKAEIMTTHFLVPSYFRGSCIGTHIE